jgi:hypothetical protein
MNLQDFFIAFADQVKVKVKVKSQNNFIHLKRAISIGSMQACLKRRYSRWIKIVKIYF